MTALATVALVVRDYDEAIAYYTQTLGFTLVEDTALTPGKRWVVLAPSPTRGARLLLAKANGARQQERVGDQTGGRVSFFLETENFDADHQRLTAAGVRFVREPQRESYGKVAVFEDLYGNLWDLIGPGSQ